MQQTEEYELWNVKLNNQWSIHWWSKDVLCSIHSNEIEWSLKSLVKRENHQDKSWTADESANHQSHESQKEKIQIKLKVSQDWEHFWSEV